MSKKLQTIYEYLEDFTEEEINSIINSLSSEEKEIIRFRYGDDLHNPVSSDNFTLCIKRKFYNYLVPKMRRLLAERKIEKLETKFVGIDDLVGQEQLLLELIRMGKNNNEILEILNLNTQQLYYLFLDLKNNGMMFSRKYYSDGSIKYKRVRTFNEWRNSSSFNKYRTLITDSKEYSINFLVMSDLHFGNKLERIDLVNRAFSYCVNQNINTILLVGDLIDGAYTRGEQKISDLYRQLDYFVKNYPYDKNILTFAVAGDHDYSAFNSSLNIMEMCNNFRHDIIIGGYNNAIIEVKNDRILLYHYIKNRNIERVDVPLILHGHIHKYKTFIRNKTVNVVVPSLSDFFEYMPTALELELGFNRGYITHIIVKQIYFGSKDFLLGESVFNLPSYRVAYDKPIVNIENFKKKKYVKSK